MKQHIDGMNGSINSIRPYSLKTLFDFVVVFPPKSEKKALPTPVWSVSTPFAIDVNIKTGLSKPSMLS